MRETKPDIHFRLTPAEYRHVKAVAKAMDRSAAYLINKIVREWIEKDKTDTGEARTNA